MCAAAESKRQHPPDLTRRIFTSHLHVLLSLSLVSWLLKMTSKMNFVRSLMKAAALANVPKHIDHFSKFSPSPLSMKQFLDFGECVLFVITMFTRCLQIPGHVFGLISRKKKFRFLSAICASQIFHFIVNISFGLSEAISYWLTVFGSK